MIQFKLPDMTCGHCEKTVRATVAQVDADAKVTVDLGTHQVSIDGKADRETLARAVTAGKSGRTSDCRAQRLSGPADCAAQSFQTERRKACTACVA